VTFYNVDHFLNDCDHAVTSSKGIEVLYLEMSQQCNLVVSGPLSGIECVVVLHISLGVTLCVCVCVCVCARIHAYVLFLYSN
jgi:hypothetical protein